MKCWIDVEFWIYEGREFQTDEPENINVFRYISKLGFGVYNWNEVAERKSLAWLSDVKVNDFFR